MMRTSGKGGTGTHQTGAKGENMCSAAGPREIVAALTLPNLDFRIYYLSAQRHCEICLALLL